MVLNYSFSSVLVVTGRRDTTGSQPVLPPCSKKDVNYCCIFLCQRTKVLDVNFYRPSTLIRKFSEKYFTEPTLVI